jgi:CRP-like cAMP-binding protein
MFVIERGQVEVWSEEAETADYIQLGTLGKGSFFGGVAAMSKLKRTASCRALMFTIAANLTRDDIEHVMVLCRARPSSPLIRRAAA